MICCRAAVKSHASVRTNRIATNWSWNGVVMIPFVLPPLPSLAIVQQSLSLRRLPKVFQTLLLLRYRYSTHCLCAKTLCGSGISVSAGLIFASAAWRGTGWEGHHVPSIYLHKRQPINFKRRGISIPSFDFATFFRSGGNSTNRSAIP